MPGLFVLLAIGAVGVMIFLAQQDPKPGDRAEVNGIDLIFQQAGAGFGWKPENAANASKFANGMIVQLRGKSHKWFAGLGAFVEIA
jgi:hypothetical protein